MTRAISNSRKFARYSSGSPKTEVRFPGIALPYPAVRGLADHITRKKGTLLGSRLCRLGVFQDKYAPLAKPDEGRIAFAASPEEIRQIVRDHCAAGSDRCPHRASKISACLAVVIDDEAITASPVIEAARSILVFQFMPSLLVQWTSQKYTGPNHPVDAGRHSSNCRSRNKHNLPPNCLAGMKSRGTSIYDGNLGRWNACYLWLV
jgi:hypothetical protein